MLELDHVAVSCTDLDSGADHVGALLGAVPSAIGYHPLMSTHNRLIGLGAEYLEIIAIDPAAPPPGRARWFGLDAFAGAPRLTNWILRCDDLDAALARSPGAGTIHELERGPYRWRVALPEAGALPFDNVHPLLIQWLTEPPSRALPDSGVRLTSLVVRHPEAVDLARRLPLSDPRVRIEPGGAGLEARFDTAQGPKALL